MKKILFVSLLVILFLQISCSESIKETLNLEQNKKIDTLNKINYDLPVYIDSTDFLIIPLARNNNFEKDYLRKHSYSTGYEPEYYENFIFVDRKSDKKTKLCKKNMSISYYNISYDFLKIFNKILIFYDIYSADTDKDGDIDTDDALSLYVSDFNGNNFKKITPDNVSLIAYNLDIKFGKIYIKVYNDTDKNNKFDQNDKISILRTVLEQSYNTEIVAE